MARESRTMSNAVWDVKSTRASEADIAEAWGVIDETGGCGMLLA